MTVIISFKNTSSRKGSWLILYRYTAFQSCAFRVHFVCITPVFSSHATAKLQFKLLSVGNRKACISVFSSKYRLFNSGGQRGIRSISIHAGFLPMFRGIFKYQTVPCEARVKVGITLRHQFSRCVYRV